MAPEPRLQADARSRHDPPSAILRVSGIGLVAASWLSAASFGIYIAVFYLGNLLIHHLDEWNHNLPGLYTPGAPVPLAAIAAHFLMGGIILVIGPLQLIGRIRDRFPRVHRWLGRLYVLAAGVAGLGGLVFILTTGTIGGAAMNVGFGLYGALMVTGAVQAYRYARARRWDAHRAWGIRLFALAIGSWLYRMDYGVWLTAAHRLGHTSNFHGPFDVVMAFFFYIPNLALAELLIRSGKPLSNPLLRITTVAALNGATLIVVIGTYYFLRFYWGPGILHVLAMNAK